MIGFWSSPTRSASRRWAPTRVPNFWGMVIATVALVQLGVGVWLDRHYNRDVGRFYLWAAMYPLFYWMLMLCITVIATPGALLGRGEDLALEDRRGSPWTTRPSRWPRRLGSARCGSW